MWYFLAARRDDWSSSKVILDGKGSLSKCRVLNVLQSRDTNGSTLKPPNGYNYVRQCGNLMEWCLKDPKSVWRS